MLASVAAREEREVKISLSALSSHTGSDALTKAVVKNTARYLSLFMDAIDEVMPDAPLGTGSSGSVDEDVVDILMRQRAERATESAGATSSTSTSTGGGDADVASQFPPALRRRYEVFFVADGKVGEETKTTIRECGADEIGGMVTFSGVVTRVSDVKPLIQVATYTCDVCGFEIYQEVTGRSFMPIDQCVSERCRANNTRGKLYMQTRGSKFVKFQAVQLQELSADVPVGHVPRSVTVHLKGSLTREVSAGDVIVVSGVFLPISYTGFKAIRAGLIADTFVEGMSVERVVKSYAELMAEDEDGVAAEVEALMEEATTGGAGVYDRLARSIAPEIFGMEDVKKALLLQLVGGVTKDGAGGMRIRGDINVCLMGDPGVAKSQLLKYISKMTPRGVYTTGKGSSGVGLTAAVVKDQATGEISLEGGALVLADMGICCIDEFDKMEESDRTAIHEVMEQQTISIAKAGIITTLNARTSILAAANPVLGRYNRRLSATENINLPAALLSRFDLVFLLLDTPDVDKDALLAQHICYVHRESKAPPLEFEAYSPAVIRAYVARARSFDPVVPAGLVEYVVSTYVGMREEEASRVDVHGHTSARTLLGVLRLAQALARLRFSTEVTQGDVDEGVRLMAMSKSSLTDVAATGSGASGLDAKSAIYTVVRDYDAKHGHSGVIRYADVLPLILAKGYSAELFDDVLDEYIGINVWVLSKDRSEIRFIT